MSFVKRATCAINCSLHLVQLGPDTDNLCSPPPVPTVDQRHVYSTQADLGARPSSRCRFWLSAEYAFDSRWFAQADVDSLAVSAKDQNAYMKLKFRQPGQGTAGDNARRDLKLELERAERIAKNKRKGITTAEDDDLPQTGSTAGLSVTAQQEDEQEAKRRKLIAEAAELDRDDSSDSDEEEGAIDVGGSSSTAVASGFTNGKGKGRAIDSAANGANGIDDDDDDDDSSDEEEDDEDETAELLRELEKIKRERAEEKAKQERDRAASDAISAEEAAASGNPLLNLQAALAGQRSYDSPGGSSSASSFTVKKRWDDDVIFKNQAMKNDDGKKEFVNDLIRTQFHKRFLQ